MPSPYWPIDLLDKSKSIEREIFWSKPMKKGLDNNAITKLLAKINKLAIKINKLKREKRALEDELKNAITNSQN